MIYYCANGEYALKYEINFNEDDLKRLQNECVIACGRKRRKKTHVSVLYKRPDEFIYEIDSKEVGYREDFYGDVPIYEKTYIEYEKPKLYYIINGIINGNINWLMTLYKINITKEEYSFDREISIKLKELSMIDDTEVDKKIKKYSELKSLMEEKEYNKKQIPIEEYYKKVMNAITIKLTGKISLETIRSVEEFLGYKLNIDEKEELVKTLKKTNESIW